ncbi:FGGY-family carbohydrate kinase [Cognatishimia sp.]|uniref:FGGY-family carbohydrate kinase n=1 Tax=Cognatishimia sp. TaxID=2211648 RepID=UPI003511AFC6
MADQKYILGLDAGNTVIKAVLFDLHGRPLATQAMGCTSTSPHPGHVERDLDELWRNAQSVIADCIAQAAVDAHDIIGLGCAGHGNGLYLVDREGAPIVGIQSLDTRAAETAADLSQKNGQRLHKLCLQKPWPSQTPVLLSWVKHNRPEWYLRVGKALLCKDFLTFQLTGELVSDITDMSGAGLTEMPTCAYSDELLALYGLEDAYQMLPKLIGPTDIAGTVTAKVAAATGLVAGTPVIGGFFDVVSSALGSGAVRAGDASLIAGTWSINQVFSKTPAQTEDIFMVTGIGADRFLNLESSATSAANLEWFVREFIEGTTADQNPFDYCSDLISDLPVSEDDPFFHPFLYGSGQGADFSAGFYGLRGWHTKAHMVRALLEGVVFEHRRHVDLLKAAGLPFLNPYLSGGGSRSAVWAQMFADCLGTKVTVAEAQETGALGAAIGVALATGVHPTFEAAVDAMTRPKATFTPVQDATDRFEARYAKYAALTSAMRPIWARDP